jgi:hypothetical protein
MQPGGRTQTRVPDRVIHRVGWLLLFLAAMTLWFGREWLVIVLWAVFG